MRPTTGLAALLAALAGFVDALAYGSLSGFFASSMTGNTTRAGAGIATGNYGDALMGGALVLSFLSGIVSGAILNHAVAGRRRAVLMAATALLLAGAAGVESLGQLRLAFLLLAAAMGMENGIFAREGEVAIGLTYMTGTLVRFGQRLAGSLMGTDGRFAWARDLELWVGFLGGIIAGGFAYAAIGDGAFWVAAGAASLLALLLSFLPERNGAPD
ncbi:YoaK family protein [Stakelama saccharophila]|uniref:YoaK family protein n=1 Tax=Stakelama saccharophila TaxID=3075605 RepID=A0ABZ0BB44_9SPHN|nr:YoaK family protein [Stakelama sp. W311]WNO54422.1 YoaK family protein [Stakelama sp. W311]